MYKIPITFTPDERKDRAVICDSFKDCLAEHRDGPVFVIGSWQTGDFCHIYAAAIHHFSVYPLRPFAILLVVAEEFGAAGLFNDIHFAIEPVLQVGNRFTLYHTDPLAKNWAMVGMSAVANLENARTPYDATFYAKEAVQQMAKGQPLSPVWADIVRGGEQVQSKAYNDICMSFMQEYIDRFGISSGREKFICMWGRTSGAPNPTRPLGGANPHYDSSEEGNFQLCAALYAFCNVKAIFLVGDGFNEATMALPFVFNLGAFWKRSQRKGFMGRFQENGFFNYMTTFYDCDVVHVGMKSGGMDSLGLWGQKVVFMDSMTSPQVTTDRVEAWRTPSIVPLPISAMPTSMGKAIEAERRLDPAAFKTTFGSKGKVTAMAGKALNLTNAFKLADMKKVAAAVTNLFD